MDITEDKCSHGITYDAHCVKCEEFGLKEKIKWMKPIVIASEKRLEEIKLGLKINRN